MLHLGLWLAVYVIVVVAWGVHNAWPDEMWSSLLFFPASLLLSWRLYRQNNFGLETELLVSDWELLIAYLVLAIGVASGLLLLMAAGWITLGLAWLRPKAGTVDWLEWLKVPFLSLFSLPIWLDLAGSRHNWFEYFELTSVSAADALPEGLALIRLHVLIPLCVFVLAYWLKGRVFWYSLPVVPLALLARNHLDQQFPSDWRRTSAIVESFSWFFVPVAVLGYCWVARRLFQPAPGPRGALPAFSEWSRQWFYSPWLATLVIFLQQTSLAESLVIENRPSFNLVGCALWLAALAWLRRRGEVVELDLRSRILLAAAMFILLAAEWADLNPVRHVALGVLLLGLLSWRRLWSWTVVGTGTFAWITLLPATEALLIRFGLELDVAARVRLGLCALGLGALGFSIWRWPVGSESRPYEDYAWQPVKRFAFIQLILLLGFQTISVFLLEPPADARRPSFLIPTDESFLKLRPTTQMEGMAEVQHWRSTRLPEPIELVVAVPGRKSYQLNAPELILTSWGWQVTHRRLVSHPDGLAVELTLERAGQKGCALYWFEHGGVAFTNYLRGRRILWSGWNLADRNVRLMLLISGAIAEPAKLAEFANTQNWFQPETASRIVP